MVKREHRLRIAFCHPDLGLGGAERLVVDAACELCSHGHTVDVFTAYYDRNRCFKETLSGQFSVTVAGGWFPRTIANRMHAFCAYIRCILIAIWVSITALRQGRKYDVVFVDQVSAAIPVFLLLTHSRVLFYCHFPDLLLAQKRSGIRALYRWPLDAIEETTTGQAHLILVNSRYWYTAFPIDAIDLKRTPKAGVFGETFQRLSRRGKVPEVFYPAVPIPTEKQLAEVASSWQMMLKPEVAAFMEGKHALLSINRFERKKNLGLAVRGFKAMLAAHSAEPGVANSVLVIAGGYDKRLAENRDYFDEIRDLVSECGLESKVMLLQSFTDAERSALLAAACAVVYTPTNEHFGIVPLEAMAAGRPVLACNSGGPRESVLHGSTGFLADPRAEDFARAMAKLRDTRQAESMGKLAREHVCKTFSREAFGNRLDGIVRKLAKQE